MENESGNNSKSKFYGLVGQVKDDNELLTYMQNYKKNKEEGKIEENKAFEECMEAYMKLKAEMSERGLGAMPFEQLYPDEEVVEVFDVNDIIEQIEVDEKDRYKNKKVINVEYESVQEENSKERIITGFKNIGKESKQIYKDLKSIIKMYKKEAKVKMDETKETVKKKVIKGAKTFGKGLKTVAKSTWKVAKKTGKVVADTAIKGAQAGIIGAQMAGEKIVNLHENASKRYEERKTQTIQTTLGFINSVSKHLQDKLNEKILTQDEKKRYRTVSPEVMKRAQEENNIEL